MFERASGQFLADTDSGCHRSNRSAGGSRCGVCRRIHAGRRPDRVSKQRDYRGCSWCRCS